MTEPSSKPPIPAQPAGVTFKVAAGLLVAFFVFQILALVWHFLPDLQQKFVRRLTSGSAKVVEVAATPAPTPPPPILTPATSRQPDTGRIEKVKALVAESDKAFRIGDQDLAMAKITEAEKLLPEDPGILLRIGRLYEKVGNTPAAAEVYRSVLELPNLDNVLRSQTRRKLSMLSIPDAPATPTVLATEEGADMRDQFGLQPGAMLGITDTKLTDGPDRTKTLRIAIKCRPDTKIDSREMTVHVFFYDRDTEGQVFPTESKVVTEWISPPVNWGDESPELLNATYIPPAKTGNSEPALSYEGYVVGIYYNNELQDTRAAPGSLASEHPLPVSLTSKTP
jgi:hypothetical protein